MSLKIKVCGLKFFSNTLAVSGLKPDYLGFIFYRQSPRYMGEMISAAHLALLSEHIKKVGVFVNASVKEIHATAKAYGLDCVQLHGDEPPELCRAAKELGLPVWKAFRIDSAFDFSRTAAYEPFVEAFVFDSTGSGFGGHGTVFDWNSLVRYNGSIPFFLSGGLSPENVATASMLNHPKLIGLDINSRFERIPGLKDMAKIHDALNQLSDKKQK